MLASFEHHVGDFSLSLNLRIIFVQHRATLLGQRFGWHVSTVNRSQDKMLRQLPLLFS